MTGRFSPRAKPLFERVHIGEVKRDTDYDQEDDDIDPQAGQRWREVGTGERTSCEYLCGGNMRPAFVSVCCSEYFQGPAECPRTTRHPTRHSS